MAMTGKRTIKVHGEKIAKARAEKKLDQESFAGMIPDVGLRTLQRAEKSGMISLGKIRRIADALNVNPEELIQDESVATSKDNRNDGFGTLILKPMCSHKDFQQLSLLHRPKLLDLDYQINPQPEYIEKVAGVIEEIQRWIKLMSSGEYEYVYEDWDDPPDHAKRFKRDMEFTRNLVDLWDGGISVFAGHYTNRTLIWAGARRPNHYDETFTQMWYPQLRSIAVLRFFDDKNMAQDKEISERVYYGLSLSNWGKWARAEQKDIRVDGSTNELNADNQIKPDAIREWGFDVDEKPF